MKTTYKYILAILLILPSFGSANNSESTTKKREEKTKTIRKNFSVNSDAKVDIKNKYGDINVTTWDQNTVEIIVRITVKARNIEDIDEQLDMIDVEFSNSSSLVSAVTHIKKKKSGWSFWGNNNSNIQYKINYTIKMPETNRAHLTNDYGGITLDKLSGDAHIDCDYGKIDIGELMGKNNTIVLDYCGSSYVNSATDLDIDLDYSKLTVDKAKKVKLNSDYSTLKFGEILTLGYDMDYGGINVENVDSMTGNSDYTSIRIGTLNKKLNLTTDYGSVKINEIRKGFDSVYIEGDYAGIKIGTSSTNNFSFIIDLSYAGFSRNESSFNISKQIEKGSNKYFEGVYGKGKPSSKITIDSSYGSVKFIENY